MPRASPDKYKDGNEGKDGDEDEDEDKDKDKEVFPTKHKKGGEEGMNANNSPAKKVGTKQKFRDDNNFDEEMEQPKKPRGDEEPAKSDLAKQVKGKKNPKKDNNNDNNESHKKGKREVGRSSSANQMSRKLKSRKEDIEEEEEATHEKRMSKDDEDMDDNNSPVMKAGTKRKPRDDNDVEEEVEWPKKRRGDGKVVGGSPAKHTGRQPNARGNDNSDEEHKDEEEKAKAILSHNRLSMETEMVEIRPGNTGASDNEELGAGSPQAKKRNVEASNDDEELATQTSRAVEKTPLIQYKGKGKARENYSDAEDEIVQSLKIEEENGLNENAATRRLNTTNSLAHDSLSTPLKHTSKMTRTSSNKENAPPSSAIPSWKEVVLQRKLDPPLVRVSSALSTGMKKKKQTLSHSFSPSQRDEPNKDNGDKGEGTSSSAVIPRGPAPPPWEKYSFEDEGYSPGTPPIQLTPLISKKKDRISDPTRYIQRFCPFCKAPWALEPSDRTHELDQKYRAGMKAWEVWDNLSAAKKKKTPKPTVYCVQISFDLCKSIQDNLDKEVSGSLPESDWPKEINLLILLATDLQENIQWQRLCTRLAAHQTTFSQLSSASRILAFSALGEVPTGYYGPAGGSVIHETILHHFLCRGDQWCIGPLIEKTFEELINQNPAYPVPGFWRGVSGQHLTIELMTDYILIPHVVTKLIADDQQMDYVQANSIHLDSQRFGNKHSCLDNPKMDDYVYKGEIEPNNLDRPMKPPKPRPIKHTGNQVKVLHPNITGENDTPQPNDNPKEPRPTSAERTEHGDDTVGEDLQPPPHQIGSFNEILPKMRRKYDMATNRATRAEASTTPSQQAEADVNNENDFADLPQPPPKRQPAQQVQDPINTTQKIPPIPRRTHAATAQERLKAPELSKPAQITAPSAAQGHSPAKELKSKFDQTRPADSTPNNTDGDISADEGPAVKSSKSSGTNSKTYLRPGNYKAKQQFRRALLDKSPVRC
ncbi:hypothetical protein CPB83DRAFT_900080 [Crepidotus variabilis]|uniref:Restriction of telomere capping protein 4 C-terminal domain-containing protein n=1 Tax=Crepidotus variabilis TaxID=179855 RepID=A0A9P6E3N7_9AGAR|nr:hypothetical protein CPB83DRAFT_900080 [Crepidotus variabilis]